MIKWLGSFMSIVLLTTFLAIAQPEDYAMIISENDDGEVVAYANLVIQTDTQVVDTDKLGLRDVGIGEEGLSAAIISNPNQRNPLENPIIVAPFNRIDLPGNEIIVTGLNLRNLPGNGIMIADTNVSMVLKDIIVESLGVKDQSSLPVGIGMQNAKNVRVENCTALGSALFRIANSQNIHAKNNTVRNFFFEGVRDGTIENCSSDCIIIKGMLSPFYFNKLKDLHNDTYSSLPRDTIVGSQRCTIRECNQLKEIDLFDAEDCSIENCSVENVGLWMMNAKNVTFRDSTVTNASLSMDWSKKINFENVTLVNSDISLGGSVPEDYAIALHNSTVDGKPIYYYENQSDLKLENLDAGHIWLVNCSGSEVNSVNALGIFVINSDGVAIKNSYIEGDGVNLAFSNDCVISNNRLTDKNSKNGILQYAACNNNIESSNVLI